MNVSAKPSWEPKHETEYGNSPEWDTFVGPMGALLQKGLLEVVWLFLPEVKTVCSQFWLV